MEHILDYHEFYERFKEEDYISLKVDYEWLGENEDYLREGLFTVYSFYKSLPIESRGVMLKGLFKLYGEMVLTAYLHFEGKSKYF